MAMDALLQEMQTYFKRTSPPPPDYEYPRTYAYGYDGKFICYVGGHRFIEDFPDNVAVIIVRERRSPCLKRYRNEAVKMQWESAKVDWYKGLLLN